MDEANEAKPARFWMIPLKKYFREGLKDIKYYLSHFAKFCITIIAYWT